MRVFMWVVRILLAAVFLFVLAAIVVWRERATILAVLQRLHLRSEPRSE